MLAGWARSLLVSPSVSVCRGASCTSMRRIFSPEKLCPLCRKARPASLLNTSTVQAAREAVTSVGLQRCQPGGSPAAGLPEGQRLPSLPPSPHTWLRTVRQMGFAFMAGNLLNSGESPLGV